MKNLLYLLPLFLISCSGQTNESDAYGNFEAIEVTLSSQSNGPILQMNVAEGDVVEKGQTIALIDTLQQHFQKQQILAQLSANTARKATTRSQSDVIDEQLRVAKREQERLTRLLKDGAATQKNVDDINGQISVLEKQRTQVLSSLMLIDAERKANVSQLAQINDAISRAHVKAPISGTILTMLSEEGELAMPGKPLMILADTETMILKAFIGAEDLPNISRGQNLTVLVDKDKESFTELTGQITWISPKAEFTPKIIQTKNERTNLVYAIKISVKNNGHLFIGMPAEIRILDSAITASK